MARDLYDAMNVLTIDLGKAVIGRYDSADEAAKMIAGTSINLPARIFSYLEREMAFAKEEWAPNTSFDPPTGVMVINGIRVNRDDDT
ncbi:MULTISPECIES: hypothetical protein [unclassified Bradyrhizobium]|uniref:hypothetical protein n=1 Tax=Bradyrhizobium TaxID=374 RepID=UPI002916CD00|nr:MULTISPECIES: hypothetical protein [unclassified Bradyrhizobium]